MFWPTKNTHRSSAKHLSINSFVHGTDVSTLPDDTHALLITVADKLPADVISKLPSTLKLIVTMSSGTDHVDVKAAEARGIEVRRNGVDTITEHVADYGVAFTILGLRDAMNQVGVPFPSSGWNLSWNTKGTDLNTATVGIVGLGAIATSMITKIKAVAPKCTVLYNARRRRTEDVEKRLGIQHEPSIVELAKKCDILVLLCPLTPETEHLISADVIKAMRPSSGILNLARGKVIDTDALTDALNAGEIKYAILDTTFPEPLPEGHALWSCPRCHILPHYATNTEQVRAALVHDLLPLLEEAFGAGGSAKDAALEAELRRDVAVAHRATAALGWDMLVWNHVSARFGDGCLITPGNMLWGQVRASDLVISSNNITADIIHAAVYAARPDIGAIIHLHTPYATAVSCLEMGFVPYTQDGAYFHGRVATYEWDGVSDDANEQPLLEAAVKSVPGCNTLLMHNHGFCCFGPTVAAAWVLAYYFERCCEVQMKLLQSGAKVKTPKLDVMTKAAETSYLPDFAPGVCEWKAIVEEYGASVL